MKLDVIDLKILEALQKNSKITNIELSKVIERQHKDGGNKIKRWASNFMNKKVCEACKGARLKEHHKYYQIHGHHKNNRQG